MSASAKQILELVEKQQYRCAITGRPLTPSDASMDHIVPLSRGGKHSIENIQIVHRQINAMKGTMTQEELIAIAREIVAHAEPAKSPISLAS